jgi:hypothetical protein
MKKSPKGVIRSHVVIEKGGKIADLQIQIPAKVLTADSGVLHQGYGVHFLPLNWFQYMVFSWSFNGKLAAAIPASAKTESCTW